MHYFYSNDNSFLLLHKLGIYTCTVTDCNGIKLDSSFRPKFFKRDPVSIKMQWKFGAWFPQNACRVQDAVPPKSLIRLSSENSLLKLYTFEKVLRKQIQGFSNYVGYIIAACCTIHGCKELKMEIYILSARYLFFPLTTSGVISWC